MLGQNENSDQLELVKKKYGFDQPLSKQYFLYLNDLSPVSFHSNAQNDYSYFDQKKYSGIGLLHFNSFSINLKYPYLRTSYVNMGKKVSDIILDTLPNTIILAIASILIASFIGIFLGVISAIFKNSKLIFLFSLSVPLG